MQSGADSRLENLEVRRLEVFAGRQTLENPLGTWLPVKVLFNGVLSVANE